MLIVAASIPHDRQVDAVEILERATTEPGSDHQAQQPDGPGAIGGADRATGKEDRLDDDTVGSPGSEITENADGDRGWRWGDPVPPPQTRTG